MVGVSLVGVLGGGYLHALELVPCWLVWLPACLGACALARVLVRALLVRVLGSDYLHALARVLVRSLLVRVVGSDYLHALNLVSLVRALLVRVLGWCGYLHALNLVPCWFVSWLVVVTCMP